MPIGLSPGKYIVTADDLANGEKLVILLPLNPLWNPRTLKCIGKWISLYVKVLDDEDRPLAEVQVKFNINGVYSLKLLMQMVLLH